MSVYVEAIVNKNIQYRYRSYAEACQMDNSDYKWPREELVLGDRSYVSFVVGVVGDSIGVSESLIEKGFVKNVGTRLRAMGSSVIGEAVLGFSGLTADFSTEMVRLSDKARITVNEFNAHPDDNLFVDDSVIFSFNGPVDPDNTSVSDSTSIAITKLPEEVLAYTDDNVFTFEKVVDYSGAASGIGSDVLGSHVLGSVYKAEPNGFGVYLVETIEVSKHRGRSFFDTLGIYDDPVVFIGSVGVSNTISLSESINKDGNHSLNSNVFVKDTSFSTGDDAPQSSVYVEESFDSVFVKNLSDPVSLNDIAEISFTFSGSNSIYITATTGVSHVGDKTVATIGISDSVGTMSSFERSVDEICTIMSNVESMFTLNNDMDTVGISDSVELEIATTMPLGNKVLGSVVLGKN